VGAKRRSRIEPVAIRLLEYRTMVRFVRRMTMRRGKFPRPKVLCLWVICLCLIFLELALLYSLDHAPGPTWSNFARIKKGMPKTEVLRILGKPDAPRPLARGQTARWQSLPSRGLHSLRKLVGGLAAG
jgi:hypothetical protein